MNEQSYFVFSLNQCLYGISTSHVQEVCSLYELASLPEMPHEVISIISFRGNTLLVIDISPIFNQEPIDYSLTDSLLVLGWETLQLGLIVNEVHDVISVPYEEIITDLSQVQEITLDAEQKKLIAGVVRKEENILILNHPEKWLKHPTVQQLMSVSKFARVERQISTDQIQPDDSGVLLDRAIAAQSTAHTAHVEYAEAAADQDSSKKDWPDQNSSEPLAQPFAQPFQTLLPLQTPLSQLEENQNLSTSRSLTVVSLSNALLGIDLKTVQEFVDIRKITPVPCCPKHIAGNMNFRGEILTVVDVGGLLNLQHTAIAESSKIAVLEAKSTIFGLVVDEILDVMFFIDSREIIPAPADYALNSAYLQGIAPYHQRKMSILDLTKLLANSELTVDEAI